MPILLNVLVAIVGTLLGIFIHPGLFGILGLLIIPLVAEIFLSVETSGSTVFAFKYLFRLKRVKTQFGKFYLFIHPDGDEVNLMQDRFFYYKYIANLSFNPDDMDGLKSRVKYYTDSLYEDKIKKRESINKLKKWNGYLDKQSERDSKLEELGV